MSTDRLTQVLVDVTRGRSHSAFLEDPDAVLDASGLSTELIDAIKQNDYAELHRAGAHPMALLYLSRAMGCPLDSYLDQLARGGAAR